jgi:plastocyanin
MRVLRMSAVVFAAVLLLGLVTATAALAKPQAAKAHTYKVLVGAEQARRGVSLMGYYPRHITIHVGDTVRWVQNSNEIHTVTFLGGQALQDFVLPAASLGLPTDPSPAVINPLASTRSDGPVIIADATTWANSGIMGREPGQFGSFTATFSAEGTYPYVCYVHGTAMSGAVTVVGSDMTVPTPQRYMARAHRWIAHELAQAPAVFRAARRHVQPATKNQDGTWTHYIQLGYSKGQIMLMRFFPSQVRVHPGDTVEWMMTTHNDAPHTVTFLNGQTEPPLVDPVQVDGSLVLYLDPGVVFPAGSTTLTRTGLYNSGLLQPIPGASWSYMVGDVAPGPLRYLCQLHDTSGMRGTLVVLPQ